MGVWRRADIEWAIEDDFDKYVARISGQGIWGGEPELLMLSHHLERPIEVYMRNPGLRVIQTYGEDFKKAAVRVIFHGVGHYEALTHEGNGPHDMSAPEHDPESVLMGATTIDINEEPAKEVQICAV